VVEHAAELDAGTAGFAGVLVVVLEVDERARRRVAQEATAGL
jgi:hypothetical protein